MSETRDASWWCAAHLRQCHQLTRLCVAFWPRTYETQYDYVRQRGVTTLTPFFSPDHSIDTLTNLIQNAPAGSTITIGTPDFGSWLPCSYSGTNCQGCSVANQSAETFPIFPAMLNAVHQNGVKIQLLTNNYNEATCTGLIAPLDYLALNPGITIRYFTSVTFLHAKYMAVSPPSGRFVMMIRS